MRTRNSLMSTNHKSIKYLFVQKELNIKQIKRVIEINQRLRFFFFFFFINYIVQELVKFVFNIEKI
jgi:hypothetical protein